jgi:hypothetical protein
MPTNVDALPNSDTLKDQKFINNTIFRCKANGIEHEINEEFYIDQDGEEITQAPVHINITASPYELNYNPTGNNKYQIDSVNIQSVEYYKAYNITEQNPIDLNTEFDINQNITIIPVVETEEEVDHYILDDKFVYELDKDFLDNNNIKREAASYIYNPIALSIDKLVSISSISMPTQFYSNYGYYNDMDMSYKNSVNNVVKVGDILRGDNTIYEIYVISIIAEMLPVTLEIGVACTNNTNETITNGVDYKNNGVTFIGDGQTWDVVV